MILGSAGKIGTEFFEAILWEFPISCDEFGLSMLRLTTNKRRTKMSSQFEGSSLQRKTELSNPIRRDIIYYSFCSIEFVSIMLLTQQIF
jgi:hypothetical protein